MEFTQGDGICDMEVSSYLNIINGREVDYSYLQAPIVFDNLTIHKSTTKHDFLTECVNRERDLPCLCRHCRKDLADVIEQQYEETQNEIRMYALFKHDFNSRQDQALHFDETANLEATQVAKELVGIKLKVEGDKAELAALERDQSECKDHLNEIARERESVWRDMEAEAAEIARLEGELAREECELLQTLEVMNSSIQEINFMKGRSMSHMFDTCTASGLKTINGFRLNYTPDSNQNLNWAEINIAWSCTSLLLVALRNLHGLSAFVEIANVIKPSACGSPQFDGFVSLADSGDRAGERTQQNAVVRVHVRPLRRRALILVDKGPFNDNIESPGHPSPKKSPSPKTGNKSRLSAAQGRGQGKEGATEWSKNGARAVPDVLCLEGGDDEPAEYRPAVLLFAAFVCITACQLGRADALTRSMRNFNEQISRGEFWEYDEDVGYYDALTAIDAGAGSSQGQKTGSAKMTVLVDDLVVSVANLAT